MMEIENNRYDWTIRKEGEYKEYSKIQIIEIYNLNKFDDFNI